jgi:hypothetical protein
VRTQGSGWFKKPMFTEIWVWRNVTGRKPGANVSSLENRIEIRLSML